jgi:hypothetical protein
MMIVAEAIQKGGAEYVLMFWAFLGLFQWIYLLPVALLARWIGFRFIAHGIWISGAVVMLLTAMCWGPPMLIGAAQWITGTMPANTELNDNYGSVVRSDRSSVTVKLESGGTQASYVLEPGTRFIFLGPAWQQQPSPASAAWLTKGRRVEVDYHLRAHVKYAAKVIVWVEKPEPAP